MANNAETDIDARSLLLTRPRESAQRFLGELDAKLMAGVTVVVSPLIEIVAIGKKPNLSAFAGAIFTSAHAPPLAPCGEGKPAFCVGAGTARAARVRGWDVLLVAETAEDLVAQIKDSPTPLIHLSGRHRRGEIAERLSATGTETKVHVLYDQRPQALSGEAQQLLRGPTGVVVPLFSPRTAKLFYDQVTDLSKVFVIAISDAVAELVEGSGCHEVITARAPTGVEMRRSVEMRLRGTRLA
ncbi:MAG: uroporphyrinogen-III synthase [Sulfitobacter sp.]|nr:uroporphyrinogen-III synthase [Sulfitobacter sp.]